MKIKHISNTLAVSPQIVPADVKAIAEQGFRSIICNRPDGEGADQPGFSDIQEAARKAGIECRYLPVRSGNVRHEDAEAFARMLEQLPKPALAYCLSGTRSSTLWSMSQGTSGTPLPVSG